MKEPLTSLTVVVTTDGIGASAVFLGVLPLSPTVEQNCNKSLVLEVVAALGSTWHPDPTVDHAGDPGRSDVLDLGRSVHGSTIVNGFGLNVAGNGAIYKPVQLWFLILFAVSFQASFLTRLVGFALLYLRGVPDADNTDGHLRRYHSIRFTAVDRPVVRNSWVSICDLAAVGSIIGRPCHD